MDQNKKLRREHLEKQVFREVASQIPVHAVKSSYNRMLSHCITSDVGKLQPVWACAIGGAPVRGRMVKMRILDRATGQQVDYAPVITFYCSGCDAVPGTHGGDTIFSDEIQTLAV